MIVLDPRHIGLLDTPHRHGALHLPLMPGTNVAVLTAMAHVIAAEGLYDETYIRDRCDWDEFLAYRAFLLDPRHSPEAVERGSRVPADLIRQAARAYAAAPGPASITGWA